MPAAAVNLNINTDNTRMDMDIKRNRENIAPLKK